MKTQSNYAPCKPRQHTIKIHPRRFDAVKSGRKKCEVRLNDRDYQVGDLLVLREFYAGRYTGRFLRVRVTYVLTGDAYQTDNRGIGDEWVVLSVNLEKGQGPREIKIIIPWVGPSTNEIYSGINWRRRKRIVDVAHQAVSVAVKQQNVPTALWPCRIEFKAIHAGRLYDTSNYSFMGKTIEDGLVRAKVLRGDEPEHVRAITWYPAEKKKRKTDPDVVLVRLIEEAAEERKNDQ